MSKQSQTNICHVLCPSIECYFMPPSPPLPFLILFKVVNISSKYYHSLFYAHNNDDATTFHPFFLFLIHNEVYDDEIFLNNCFTVNITWFPFCLFIYDIIMLACVCFPPALDNSFTFFVSFFFFFSLLYWGHAMRPPL